MNSFSVLVVLFLQLFTTMTFANPAPADLKPLPGKLNDLPDCAKNTLDTSSPEKFTYDETTGEITGVEWSKFCNDGPYLLNFIVSHSKLCTEEERAKVIDTFWAVCGENY